MDGNILDLLMQADPGMEGRAVQDELRKRAAVGALIQGIGGRRFGPMGAGMVKSAERGQAGQNAGVLRLALEQAKAKNPRPAQPSSLGKLIAERDSLPPDSPLRATYDEAIKLATSPKGMPYVALPSGEGYVSFDKGSGKTSAMTVDGRRPKPPAVDPEAQAIVTEAKARGKASGEATGKAGVDLPRVTDQAEETLRLTEELLGHPGLQQAVGASSLLGVQKIPGTAARDFQIRLDQLRGKQFLEAFQSLKGAGQITEVEGQKATEAIARMDSSGSEEEFRRAVRDFQDIVKRGLSRVRNLAGGPPTAGTSGAPRRRRFNPATGKLE